MVANVVVRVVVKVDDTQGLSFSLLFQITSKRDSNRAKLGPEQGTKQQIPPTFIKNWGIPQIFWVYT